MEIIFKRFFFVPGGLSKVIITFNYSSIKVFQLEIALSQILLAQFLAEVSRYWRDITARINLHVKKYLIQIYFYLKT